MRDSRFWGSGVNRPFLGGVLHSPKVATFPASQVDRSLETTVDFVTGTEAADIGDEPASGRASDRSSMLARHGLTGWDGLALVLMLLLLTVYFPPFYFDSWTPRFAIVLGVAPLGLALLALACSNRDRTSMLLGVALGWTILSAAVSGNPRSALLGFSGRDLSALSVVGAAGLWSVGRMTSVRGRELAPYVLVLASSFGGVVGIAQVVMGVDSGPLAMMSGRPTGLVSNPVYFGALSCVGAVTATSLWSYSGWRWLTPSIVVLGLATTLSGSRVAFLAALVSGVGLLAVHRSRTRLVGCSVLLASLVAGVGIDRLIGAGRNAADRFAATSGSGDGRLQVWQYGYEALIERPVLGYSFGLFRPAVQSRFTADFVRESAPDELTQAWFDPHNVGVLLLVSVGIVGTVLYLVWAGAWARRIRGPLVWALIAVGCHWMLQPVSLFTLPLAMLLFGVAGRPDTLKAPEAVPVWLTGVVGLLGLIVAGGLVVNDLRLGDAVSGLDGPQAASVSRWFLNDPITADVTARVFDAASAEGLTGEALVWRARAAEYEPDRPLWWSALAQAQFDRGLDLEAEKSLAKAFELQRYNQRSQRVEVLLALRARDEERLQEALDLACELGQSDCDLEAAELIDQLSLEE